MEKKCDIKKLIISLSVPFIIASLGGIATGSSVSTWYLGLNKPFFNPPSWLFGPVWTILYLMIGLSFYKIWCSNPKKNVFKNASVVYTMQLLLNLLWSIAFFGLRSPFLGLVVIVPLLASIALNIFEFYKIKKSAAYMLVPYIIWVSFATVLNFSLWFLNM